MVNGTTKTGFNFSIEESVLEDWTLTEKMADLLSGDVDRVVTGMVDVVKLLLGNEGYEALKKHVQSLNNGRMPVEAVRNEITDIFNCNQQIKN